MNTPLCTTPLAQPNQACAQCTHAIDAQTKVFQMHTLAVDETMSIDTNSCHHILMVSKGELKLTLSSGTIHRMHAAQIMIIPHRVRLTIQAQGCSEFLLFNFDTYANVCPYVNSTTFKQHLDQHDYTFYMLTLSSQLERTLDLFLAKAQVGPQCGLYQDNKRREFFSLLSLYYSEKEMARFLYPLLSDEYVIVEVIGRYGDKVKSAHELIELSGLSRSAFYEKFKEFYGMPVKQWLLQRKAAQVKKRLTEPGAVIKEIRYEFGFNSSSQFNRFCNAYLGANPSDLVRQRQRSKI